MKILEWLRSFRCPLCLKERQSISILMDEIRVALYCKKESLPLPSPKIESSIPIDEREAILKKQEEAFFKLKESLAGPEGAEIKRDILMPSLKERWAAEKKKIDSERVQFLLATPKTWFSLESKKQELEKIIANIKSKPASSSNQVLLNENQGKLKQLQEIIVMIDMEKNAREPKN